MRNWLVLDMQQHQSSNLKQSLILSNARTGICWSIEIRVKSSSSAIVPVRIWLRRCCCGWKRTPKVDDRNWNLRWSFSRRRCCHFRRSSTTQQRISTIHCCRLKTTLCSRWPASCWLARTVSPTRSSRSWSRWFSNAAKPTPFHRFSLSSLLQQCLREP